MAKGISLPFIVLDNMTQLKHTVTAITETPDTRWYWIDGKRYEAARFTTLR